MKPILAFEFGTVIFSGLRASELPPALVSYLRYDPRTMNFRARGCDYAFIVAELQKNGVIFEDKARKFAPLDELTPAVKFVPRTHQNSAFNAWKANASRGIAALPTGSGKTMLAIMATAYLKCPTIFLVPTLDLLGQWAEVLGHYFNCEIGMLGGGERSIRELTVSTYDSAVLNMEFIGDRFGFLVADECHHLPGPETRLAGAMAIAPYRLGLSATPELPDDRAAVLEDLLGPIVCRVEIGELAGTVLSPYHTVSMPVKLDPDEAEAYEFNRKKYTDFLAANRLNFHYKSEWGRFLGLCARLPGGRDVFRAFIEQRRIARGGEAKIRAVWNLVTRHAAERIIIFTADNATAYDLGRRFFWPVITHHTRPQERKEFLGFFREGKYLVLVTSKVLNEGVDVPSVAVGIVLSGSASVREHVQRLGRILRPAPGKEQAVLYELVSAGTSEESVSARRREHKAYSE